MEQREIGTVAALWRYPVKSMLGEEVESSPLTERGLRGDRAYALVDVESGRVVSAKAPRLWARLFELRASLEDDGGEPPGALVVFPDGATMATSDAGIERRLSEFFGREVRLATEPPAGARYASVPVGSSEGEATAEYPLNGFFDLGALHLLTTASLSRLRELYPQGDWDVRRFRPNVVVATPEGEAGFVENDWAGKTLAIGEEVRLRVMSTTIRCVMTTLPQGDPSTGSGEGLPHDPAILRTAAQSNRANVGVYAMALEGGTVRRGDAVRVVSVNG